MSDSDFRRRTALPPGPADREALSTSEERVLVARARAGDRRALRRLLEGMSRPIYRFGRGFCRNPEDAEDIMQETLASLVRSLPTFRGDSSLTTWAYTVARNACLRQRRKLGGGAVSLEALRDPDDGGGASFDIADERPGPALDLERRELEQALANAILSLPVAQREVLVLRDVEGLDARAAARVLRIQERALKSRLHRARLALREALRPHLGDGPEGAARRPGCPDTARMLSRYIEGELDASHCRSMAEHVERCGSCDRACRELRRTLTTCRRYGSRPLPRGVRDSIRRSIRAVLAARGAGAQLRNPL